MSLLRETYAVAWADLRFMRHHLPDIAVSTLMSPLLYVLVFGYGLASYMTGDGTPYLAIVIPGIAAMTTLSSSFSSTAARLQVQRLFYSCFDEMMLCPISTPAMVLGKAVMGVIRGMLGSMAILCIGLALSPGLILSPLLVACMLLSCLTFSFLGIATALISKSHQGMTTINNLVILPMTFLCGTFFSVSSMAPAIKAALFVFPLSHSTEAARAAALGWEFPWLSLLALCAFCAAFFILDVHLVRSKKS
ncbi:MAG: ABC transporter permease [Candidatus Methanoplasma sp.]|nr:ABC transporter permease [Candidatus Methanoplasma sp.]